MSVQTFLIKADALQRKGPFALFSSDYRLLKHEAENAGDELKAERKALVKAGKPTPFCPPKNGDLGKSELLAAFRSIPAGERSRISVKAAMRAHLARKWPCPA